MGRRKKIEHKDPLHIAMVNMEEGMDPYRALIQELKFEVNVPDDTAPELLLKLLQQNFNDYELVSDDNGKRKFRTKQARRVEILKEIIKYNHPQLKSTENKTESDLKISVVVKSFDLAAPQVVVESAVRAALPEVIEANVEEDSTDA